MHKGFLFLWVLSGLGPLQVEKSYRAGCLTWCSGVTFSWRSRRKFVWQTVSSSKNWTMTVSIKSPHLTLLSGKSFPLVWWSSNFPYSDIVPMHKSWRMEGWLIWKADGVNEVWVGFHLFSFKLKSKTSKISRTHCISGYAFFYTTNVKNIKSWKISTCIY